MAKKFFIENNIKFINEINIKKAVLDAYDEVNKKYKLSKKYDTFPWLMESGESVGKILEHLVPVNYTKNSKSGYTFIFGKNERIDLDTICNENTFFSSEFKSTSQKRNTPVGTSTHINFGEISKKHEEDEYSFYVFSPYKFVYESSEDLCIPRFIAVGLLKPSDWIRTGENGNGATISTETFINQFVVIWINPEEKFTLKSPELNLKKLNINNGETLQLCNTKSVIIEVIVKDADNNIVSYHDNENIIHNATLIDVTKKFGKKSYVNNIKKYWKYNGETLTNINNKVYKMTYIDAA